MTSTVKTKNPAASLMQSIGSLPSVLQSPLNRNILEAVGVQAGTIHQHMGRRDPIPGLKPYVLLGHHTGWEELCIPRGALSSQPQIWVHGFQVTFLGRTGILAWNQDEASLLPVVTVQLWAKFHICCLKLLKWLWAWQWAVKIFFSINSESQLNMQSFKDCKAQKGQKQWENQMLLL